MVEDFPRFNPHNGMRGKEEKEEEEVFLLFCFVESPRDDSGFLSPTACFLSRAARESIGTRQEAERMPAKHGQEP